MLASTDLPQFNPSSPRYSLTVRRVKSRLELAKDAMLAEMEEDMDVVAEVLVEVSR